MVATRLSRQTPSRASIHTARSASMPSAGSAVITSTTVSAQPAAAVR
ncbi:MAG TPA: hypothetical protein VM759_01460 [Longimicrobium sp.]|nr:hypothetical protein [Longimicrobium sp.]